MKRGSDYGFGYPLTCSTLKDDDVADGASLSAATSLGSTGSHRRGISGGGIDGGDGARQVDAGAEEEAIAKRCEWRLPGSPDLSDDLMRRSRGLFGLMGWIEFDRAGRSG